MTYYRKDLFTTKNLTMPAQPTYNDIERFAQALTDKPNQLYGICLRGQSGWGANMALLSTMVNTFGGRWFDESWHATINSPEWKNAVAEYIKLLTLYGPPGASANNFNENLALFAGGHCAMWIDATVAAGIFSAICCRNHSCVCSGTHRRDAARGPLVVGLGARDCTILEPETRSHEVCRLGDIEGLHQERG